jgi:hypothetical protein
MPQEDAIWAIGQISVFRTNDFFFRFDFLRVWDTEEGGEYEHPALTGKKGEGQRFDVPHIKAPPPIKY